MEVQLSRIYQDDCTIGILECTKGNQKFRCFTLELPYRNNKSNISCIPRGEYPCYKTVSPKFGDCLAVDEVNGRSFIRIHKGNFTYQIEGCILVGDSLADINKDGIPDVTNSVKTLNALLEFLPSDFTLKILN